MTRPLRRSAAWAALLCLLGPTLARDAAARTTPPQLSPAALEILELVGPPSDLDLQAQGPLGPWGGDATARRIEAWRRLQRLPVDERQALQGIFAGPGGRYECLESETYPVRSCYRNPAHLSLAEFQLEEAEIAWELLVDGLGFWPSWRQGPDGPEIGMDYFLGDTWSIGASGYTSPVDQVGSTPQYDCSAYIVMEERAEAGPDMGRTIRHEFCHACQMAMDCAETHSAMEATSTWLETALAPDVVDAYFYYAVSNFQTHPGRAVNWDGEDAFYKYGASLFVRFAEEFLGGGDPKAVVRLWRDTVQYDEINEPDLLDAALIQAEEQGLDFADLVQAFGEWRFFLGTNDDGQHFRQGAQWPGTEPGISDEIPVRDLALLPQEKTVILQTLGYYYAELLIDTTTLPEGHLEIGGRRDSLQSWGLTLWLLRAGEPARSYRTTLDRHGAEPITVPLAELQGVERAVLALTSTKAELDWDAPPRDLRFELVVDYRAQPTLGECVPASLLPGQRSSLTVQGSGLRAGMGLEVEGEGLALTRCEVVDRTHLRCDAAAAAEAAPGPRALVLTGEGVATEAAPRSSLRVATPAGPQPEALEPSELSGGRDLLVQLRGQALGGLERASFDCPGVEVLELLPVSDELAYLSLRVTDSPAEQTCALTLSDRWGQEGALSPALSVLRAAATAAGERDSDDSGCRLASPRGPATPGRLPALLLELLLARSR